MDELDALLNEAEGSWFEFPEGIDAATEPASFGQIEMIDFLLIASCISPERKDCINSEMFEYSMLEAGSIIRELAGACLTDIRYTGTGKIQKGPGSVRANLIAALEDERR